MTGGAHFSMRSSMIKPPICRCQSSAGADITLGRLVSFSRACRRRMLLLLDSYGCRKPDSSISVPTLPIGQPPGIQASTTRERCSLPPINTALTCEADTP
jgi:hypothetical protein